MKFNRDMQMVFQDPYSSLNPKKRVLDIIAEPLRNYENLTKTEERQRVQFLEIVGLSPDSIYKYPHQFSDPRRDRRRLTRPANEIRLQRAVNATAPRCQTTDTPSQSEGLSALEFAVPQQVCAPGDPSGQQPAEGAGRAGQELPRRFPSAAAGAT